MHDYCLVCLFCQLPDKFTVADDAERNLGREAAVLSKVFRQKLKQRREELGLSVYRVAKLARLDQRAITFIERGERVPTIDSVFRIALALDIKVSDLAKLSEDEVEG